jgi:hypothetical protein
VVWIEGDAGFGKTALVRRVLAALPSDFIVMSAEADELAREQPFGVVSRLGAVTSAGSFAAGLELLRLTGERQDHRPVLVVVEDMHWPTRLRVRPSSPWLAGSTRSLSHSC